ncbi:MAG: WbqC family protein [Humidesulfovibrio sp.]|nr:WbqC family protein [Humidesulfovibrio sp.]
MIVTIHQPDFMPWLGFFERWRASDLYVILDDVQFLRRGWHHRDRIKTVSGPAWLTVPVLKKGAFDQEIREVRLEKGPWRRKHLATIRAAYARAPNFSGVFPLLEEIYGRGHDRLVELNLDLLQLFAKLLEIATPVALASDSRIEADGTIRLVRLCVAHGANVYLTGTGSRAYLDEALFAARGIRVEWQRFAHPEYPQLHGEFVPNLSALDYLMMDARPLNALGSS